MALNKYSSEWLQSEVFVLLEALGPEWLQPNRLAAAIQALSDFYIDQSGSKSPYQDRASIAASLAYFLPLNYVRALSVVDEAQRLGFFSDLTEFVDLGSGLGAATLALLESKAFERGCSLDSAKEALALQNQLLERLQLKDRVELIHYNTQTAQSFFLKDPGKTLICLSYTLVELGGELPSWVANAEALMIIEPSTRKLGRELQSLRNIMIQKGFSLWAPCTHQDSCPLLEQSEKDWCHSRIRHLASPWQMKLESLLPFRNNTLTYSYVLARKRKVLAEDSDRIRARLVGDPLVEKGKTRIALCADKNRNFLSWLQRNKKLNKLDLSRGDQVFLPKALLEHTELKSSSEIRIESIEQISPKPRN